MRSKRLQVKMLYLVEEGVCTDSLALHAATRAGVPADLIARAADHLASPPPAAHLAVSPHTPQPAAAEAEPLAGPLRVGGQAAAPVSSISVVQLCESPAQLEGMARTQPARHSFAAD